MDTNLMEIDQPVIVKGQLSDLNNLLEIYLHAKIDLERIGIYQWVESYPTKAIIEDDLKKGVLYLVKNKAEIIGAINISEEQESQYVDVNWKFDDSKVLVIHRLVVSPKHQRNGYAQMLMDFAENFAVKNGYTSIRLDAYSQNARVLKFYKKRQYFLRGAVIFPNREHPFYCMEKKVKNVCNKKPSNTPPPKQ
ncbi:MAG: GNAT family N-acetyltransferase [Bacteroidota bacterium]